MKSILRHCIDGQQEYDMLWFWCPACDEYHAVKVNNPNDYSWGWNGSEESPTITPSILVRGTKPITDDEAERIMRGEHIEPMPTVCHSFVADGKIQYLSDCSHFMAGETVELPNMDDFDL
jgi:hypothetical protein